MSTYKIKQLDWHDNGGDEWIAKSPLRDTQWYRVTKHRRRWFASGDIDCGESFKSPGEAMEYCQEHLASKLLPGLVLIDL